MGLDGFSIWHLIILLIIVAMIFGTGKLRNVGADLAAAVRSFREGLQGTADKADKKSSEASSGQGAGQGGAEADDRTPRMS